MAFRRRHAAALAAIAAATVGIVQADTYDCNEAVFNRIAWSSAKKEYCCHSKGIGCEESKSAAVRVSDSDAWAIKCSKDCNGKNTCAETCSGDQTQIHRCPAQDECPISTLCPAGTEPTDCKFSDWSAWSQPAIPYQCSGLCHRTRHVTTPNHCGGKPCEGDLEDTKECPRPESCEAKKQDCELDQWSQWSECGSRVTCQKDRTRRILTPPSNGGVGCSGETTETAACGSDCNQPRDCQMSVWMEWSQCTKKCGGGEQTRLRTIVTGAEHGGKPCVGSVSEKQACSTEPCVEEESVDCMLGDWSEWTQCINGQQKMRRRIIATPVTGEGQACEQPMAATAPCGEAKDDQPADCQMGDWAEWTLCDRTCGGGQTVRHRHVEAPAENGGASCNDALEETAVCNVHPCNIAIHPCRVSTWSEWGDCSTTCGVGQERRNRTILAEAQLGGVTCDFPLSEARGCNEGTGSDAANPDCPILDCQWSEWADWGECSAECGNSGQRSRTKYIAQHATMGGAPCEPTQTEQTEPCNNEKPCHVPHCVDGLWEAWSDWSDCTKSCRGGYRFKSRSIAVEGNHCGSPATGMSVESSTCSEDVECVQDIDCQYGDWSQWTSCPDQCSGTRSRQREIAVSAQGEGKACGAEGEAGVLSQVEACRGAAGSTASCQTKVEEDCTWGDWQEWQACSKTCGGGQSLRARQAMVPEAAPTTTASLFGRRLQMAEEGAAVGVAYDCREELANWEVIWSEAKKKACCENEGLGCPQQGLLTEGEVPIGSKLCSGPANVTKPCNMAACNAEAVDCSYGDWGMWSACTQCGGQRFRHRGVLQLPEHGGAECELTATSETEDCPRTCGPILYYCAWNAWTDWSGVCSTSCGAGVEQRTRAMALTDQMPEDPMSIASFQKDCDGELLDLRECEGNPTCAETCVPQDCSLSDWSEWSTPTCGGLCKRARTVLAANNECGKPCEGTLNATKACDADCESKDCVLSDWSSWTECASEYDQKYKTRTILVQPAFSGQGCSAALNVTGSCMTGPDAPMDCEVSGWGAWTACDKTCGGGQHVRSRTITQEAKNGGASCHEALQETAPCNADPCDADKAAPVSWDCQLSPWSLWSKCGGTSDEQTYRTRFIMHNAEGDGKACEGQLKETQGCGSSKNCILSTWSMWSECPVTCGGGQHSRSRNIEDHARGGGLQCEGALLEAEPCGTDSCVDTVGESSTACTLTDWAMWGACSATCGEGYKERNRMIAQPALAGALGCNSVLKQAMPCQAVSCEHVVDCQWGNWAEWGECVPAPDICGVGYKRRHRSIETLPSGGGRLCAPLVRDQVMPVTNCHGQPQCCINGKWAEWEEWGACSATCGRGTRKRARRLAIKETWCGEPALGGDVDFEGCDAGGCDSAQDCEFSAWSDPSPCSSDCHGHRVKTRHIAKNGTGAGAGCDGPTELTERCNPAAGAPEPFSCEKFRAELGATVDCIMGEWSEWSGCSATCERGTQHRVRDVRVHPHRGGKACDPELKEVKTCHAGVSCFHNRVNCKWGDWTEWSECNSFDLRQRSRDMDVFPAGGGLACDGDIRQVSKCPEKDVTTEQECGTEEYMCQWGQWEDWSDCSTTCGAGGERKRKRVLEVSDHTALESLAEAPQEGAYQQKYSEAELPAFEAMLRQKQAERMKETVVAFALGAGTFAVMLLAVSRARRAGEPAVREYDRVPQQA